MFLLLHSRAMLKHKSLHISWCQVRTGFMIHSCFSVLTCTEVSPLPVAWAFEEDSFSLLSRSFREDFLERLCLLDDR